MRHRYMMPFGAEVVEGGVRFALWAPSAKDVALLIDDIQHPIDDVGGGWRATTVRGVKAGARYAYRVGGQIVPDPASRFQPEDVRGPSQVVDPAGFRWEHGEWHGRPWEEAVLYEVHIGTATPEGTFAAFAEKLEELARLGITAVSIMPIGDFAGRRNWGYDGVLPFAPDSAYGTPEDLKRLVDRAHGLGLMVVLDVVYNHFGPVGNYLHTYAETFFTDRHQTPWGAGLNYDGSNGGPVRDFFVSNALYWIEEFRFDGLRFDAVHAMLDDSDEHIITEIGRRVRERTAGRHVHLILENEHNGAHHLERASDGSPILHTAQWNDDIHHCWHVLLTGESEAYYRDFSDDAVGRLARALAEGFVYQGERSANLGRTRGEPSGHLPPSAFVAFLQNHDQVGNRALGDRLSASVDPARLALARAGLLLSPQIPMLFMGEEWATERPFQFFVDFSEDPTLSEAVREGRRREFASFSSFGSGTEVPDPTAETTFRNSTLDWAERTRPEHASVLADTARLLALRRQEVVPLTRTAFLGGSARNAWPEALDVVWRFAGGTLRFAANFGSGSIDLALGSERIVWASEGASRLAGSVRLPSWTGMMTVAGSAS